MVNLERLKANTPEGWKFEIVVREGPVKRVAFYIHRDKDNKTIFFCIHPDMVLKILELSEIEIGNVHTNTSHLTTYFTPDGMERFNVTDLQVS